MRTTIELPDEILARAKSSASIAGISLRQFFMQAVEQKLAPASRKTRKAPPVIGKSRGPRINVTREQVDDAMFG